MGFDNTKSGIMFVSAKMGKFWLNEKADGEWTETIIGTKFTGYLVGTTEKFVEKTGTTYLTLQFRDVDKDAEKPFVYISFNKESGALSGVAARLTEVDLAKPMTLIAIESDRNEKATFLTVWQDGKSVEKNPNAVTKSTKVGKSTDWSAVVSYWDNVVVPTINEKLAGLSDPVVEVEEEQPF